MAAPFQYKLRMKELFDQYVNKVCEVYYIKPEELFRKTKRRDVSEARHLLYYLCYQRGIRPTTIQRLMDGRGYVCDHRPICYGISSVAKRVVNDGDLRYISDVIHQKVKFKNV